MKRRLIIVAIAIMVLMSITSCRINEPNEDILENENGTEEIKSEKDNDDDNTTIEYELTAEGIIKPEFAKSIIEDTSDKVIHAISTKDSEAISDFVHPEKGVRFTPYTHVSLADDIVLNKNNNHLNITILYIREF